MATQVAVRVEDEFAAEIDAFAQRWGLDRSNALRLLLRIGLASTASFVPAQFTTSPDLGKHLHEAAKEPTPQMVDETDAAEEADDVSEAQVPYKTEATIEGKHLHRFVDEIDGTRKGHQGVFYADFRCGCGQVATRKVKV